MGFSFSFLSHPFLSLFTSHSLSLERLKDRKKAENERPDRMSLSFPTRPDSTDREGEHPKPPPLEEKRYPPPNRPLSCELGVFRADPRILGSWGSLLDVEPGVLQQDHGALLGVRAGLLHLRADHVLHQLHLGPQLLLHHLAGKRKNARRPAPKKIWVFQPRNPWGVQGGGAQETRATTTRRKTNQRSRKTFWDGCVQVKRKETK